MGERGACPRMDDDSQRAGDWLQPFSQKSHTPTVAKEFQIGLYGPTEADLEHFWNCCSEGFLGERLYYAVCLANFTVWSNEAGVEASTVQTGRLLFLKKLDRSPITK